MTKKSKICGWQPTGKSEDVPRPPKFNSANTDKLEEYLLPYSKEMVQKIRDEKMQLVTADEFIKLHKESLTAIRENDKLQEQLNTAKKALTSIKWRTERDELETYYVERNHDIRKDAIEALAAIGGDDE